MRAYALAPIGRPLGRVISVDHMSQKDESGKQTQDQRDSFNHFYAPMFTLQVAWVGRDCFKIASSVRDNGFVGTAQADVRCDGSKHPVNAASQIPDSPAAFLESWRG